MQGIQTNITAIKRHLNEQIGLEIKVENEQCWKGRVWKMNGFSLRCEVEGKGKGNVIYEGFVIQYQTGGTGNGDSTSRWILSFHDLQLGIWEWIKDAICIDRIILFHQNLDL